MNTSTEHNSRPALNDQRVQQILQFGAEYCRDRNLQMNIAVVDSGANLTGFIRMDQAFIGSADIAMKKARTSALFRMKSGDIGKNTLPGQDLYQIELSNGGLITFAGGTPLFTPGGDCIGAIGVSGGSVGEDDCVASACADFLQQEIA